MGIATFAIRSEFVTGWKADATLSIVYASIDDQGDRECNQETKDPDPETVEHARMHACFGQVEISSV